MTVGDTIRPRYNSNAKIPSSTSATYHIINRFIPIRRHTGPFPIIILLHGLGFVLFATYSELVLVIPVDK